MRVLASHEHPLHRPGRPFLAILAQWWIDGASAKDPLAIADGLILLPTRRAARSLGEAFLRITAGRPLLLPRILAIGALDEARSPWPARSTSPPRWTPSSVSPSSPASSSRCAAATAPPSTPTAPGAWPANSPTSSTKRTAPASRSPTSSPRPPKPVTPSTGSKPSAFSRWVTEHWPVWLADNTLTDSADRALRLLECQAEAWAARRHPAASSSPARRPASPPSPPSCASSPPSRAAPSSSPASTTPCPTTSGSCSTTATPSRPAPPPFRNVRHPRRRHPDRPAGSQAGSPQGTPAGPSGRRRAPRPHHRPRHAPRRSTPPLARPLRHRHDRAPPPPTRRPAGGGRRHRARPPPSARTPRARAALVTPDRQLALRVAAELARYGVIVDDSAGEPLADTPPATFLRLLARAAADGLPPIALLSVLKHPFAAFGLSTARCRSAARALERACLRGPAPPPGVAGLRAVIAALDRPPRDDVFDLLDRLESRLAP